jgi:hypothetical protein
MSGDPVEPSASRGLSAFDLSQNFVANYRYRLPVEHALRVDEHFVRTAIARVFEHLT